MLIMKNFTASKKEMENAGVTVLIFTDEDGNDWHASQKNFSKTSLKFTFDGKGAINSASWDVSMLTPENLSVGEVTKSSVPATFFDNGTRWVFSGKKIVPYTYSPEELTQQAEEQRESLMSYAQSKIAVGQTKLAIGRTLTEAELARLNTWLDYIDALEALDISVSPVRWPEVPDNVA